MVSDADSDNAAIEPPASTATLDNRCPRCGRNVRYKACARCHLRLYCPNAACGVRLTDPVGQRACMVCNTPIDQPAFVGDGVVLSFDDAVPQSEPQRAGVPTVPHAIAALLSAHRDPGEPRRMAAGYAAALLAAERAADALQAVESALNEPGHEPSRGDLLLLRARCSQVRGDVGGAVTDLADAVAEDGVDLDDIAPQLHSMLPAARAAEPRRRLLRRWAPSLDAGDRLPPQILRLLLHAAVLEGDEALAHRAITAAETADPANGVQACRELLLDVEHHAKADVRIYMTLAHLQQGLAFPDDAARVVDEAIALTRAAGDDPLQVCDLLEFKARLFDPYQEPEAAAAAYYDAGVEAHGLDDFPRAQQLLEKSAELRESSATWWYLADVRRMQAVPGVRLAEQREMLDAALDDWHRGAEGVTFDGATAWGLGILGNVLVDLAQCGGDAAARHAIDAAVAFERVILLEGDTPDTLRSLADCYRALEAYALGLDAARRSHAMSEPSARVDFTLGLAMLDTGDGEWQPLFVGISEDPTTPAFLRAVVYYLLGRPDEARDLLGSMEEQAQDDPTESYFAALVAFRAGHDDARAYCARLVELIESGDPRAEGLTPDDRADIYLMLGRYDQAISLAAPACETISTSIATATTSFFTLALAHLMLGHDAEFHAVLLRARPHFRSVLLIDEALRTLDQLRSELVARGSEVGADELEQQLREARRELLDERGAPDVALRVLSKRLGEQPTPEPSHGVLGGLAASRLMLAEERWFEAADACLGLLAEGAWGPDEADSVLDRLLIALDLLLAGKQSAPAQEVIDRALAVIGGHGDAAINARRLVLHLAANDLEQARQAAERASSVQPKEMADLLRRTVGDPKELRDLSQAARRLDMPSLTAAYDDLCDEIFQLNPAEADEAEWSWPLVSPIVVNIAGDLVPGDVEPEGPLFAKHIPALRSRVEEDTGVTVPGIQVRQDANLAPGRFDIRLCDGWPTEGEVVADHVFVRRPTGEITARWPDQTDVRPTEDPVSREPATWVRVDHAARPRSGLVNRVRGRVVDFTWRRFLSGADAWDEPIAYPLRVLERTVRDNLASFVTIDEVATMLDAWKSSGVVAYDAVVDPVRLATLFRDLVSEGVALRPMDETDGLVVASDPNVSYAAALDACRQAFAAEPSEEA